MFLSSIYWTSGLRRNYQAQARRTLSHNMIVEDSAAKPRTRFRLINSNHVCNEDVYSLVCLLLLLLLNCENVSHTMILTPTYDTYDTVNKSELIPSAGRDWGCSILERESSCSGRYYCSRGFVCAHHNCKGIASEWPVQTLNRRCKRINALIILPTKQPRPRPRSLIL